MLNSINSDGTKNGFDIELLAEISSAVNIPVVASGGAGKMAHFLEVFQETNISGALAASVFHKNEISIMELKRYLLEKNICVRI